MWNRISCLLARMMAGRHSLIAWLVALAMARSNDPRQSESPADGPPHRRPPALPGRVSCSMRTPVEPILLVHGGAGNIPDEMVAAYLAGVRAALDAGWAILERPAAPRSMRWRQPSPSWRTTGPSMPAVGACSTRMAGSSSMRCIMDGASLAAGGVAAVETVPQSDPGRARGHGALAAGLLRRSRRRTLRRRARLRADRQRGPRDAARAPPVRGGARRRRGRSVDRPAGGRRRRGRA